MIPKIGKPPRKPRQSKATPERVIQAQVESYLRLRRIPYLRLPDSIYRSIGRMSKGDSLKTAQAITGYADLTLFKVTPDGFTMCLPLELKTKTGKLSEAQKMWQEKIGTKVARSFEEAVKLIDGFWNQTKEQP